MFSVYALVASVVPFGTFMLDKQLRKKEVLIKVGEVIA
jgi:hypothetical protein